MPIHSPRQSCPLQTPLFSGLLRPGASPRTSRAGFSLVEVAIAIGIMGGAFAVIIGLMTVALTSFHQSKNVSVSSLIAQQIFSQAQVMSFNTLTNGGATTYYQLPNPNTNIGGTIRYFDDQGNEMKGTAGAFVYEVNVRVVTSTPFLLTSGTISNPSLATVTVQVAYNPGGLSLTSANGLWTGTTTGNVPIEIYTYNSLVAQGS